MDVKTWMWRHGCEDMDVKTTTEKEKTVISTILFQHNKKEKNIT